MTGAPLYCKKCQSCKHRVVIPNLSTLLTSLRDQGQYFMEYGDQDIIIVQVEKMALLVYKSLQNQKLLMNFVARMTNIGTPAQDKVRFIHRTLSLSMPIGEALRSVGAAVGTVISDDFSNLVQINTQLAPHHIQIFVQP